MMDENGNENGNENEEEKGDENGVIDDVTSTNAVKSSTVIDKNPTQSPDFDPMMNGQIRTLNGEIAGDEFAADAINYQTLLGKIDNLLERLKLDA